MYRVVHPYDSSPPRNHVHLPSGGHAGRPGSAVLGPVFRGLVLEQAGVLETVESVVEVVAVSGRQQLSDFVVTGPFRGEFALDEPGDSFDVGVFDDFGLDEFALAFGVSAGPVGLDGPGCEPVEHGGTGGVGFGHDVAG